MISIECKKTSNLIKVISSYNICTGIISQQAKKPLVIQYQKIFDFFENFSVPFHQIIFNHSISCVFLIDEPNEAAKTQKHLKEIPYPPKKAFKKKRK